MNLVVIMMKTGYVHNIKNHKEACNVLNGSNICKFNYDLFQDTKD